MCDICGKASCCVSFHPVDEQERFSDVIAAFETAREMRDAIRDSITEQEMAKSVRDIAIDRNLTSLAELVNCECIDDLSDETVAQAVQTALLLRGDPEVDQDEIEQLLDMFT